MSLATEELNNDIFVTDIDFKGILINMFTTNKLTKETIENIIENYEDPFKNDINKTLIKELKGEYKRNGFPEITIPDAALNQLIFANYIDLDENSVKAFETYSTTPSIEVNSIYKKIIAAKKVIDINTSTLYVNQYTECWEYFDKINDSDKYLITFVACLNKIKEEDLLVAKILSESDETQELLNNIFLGQKKAKNLLRK